MKMIYKGGLLSSSFEHIIKACKYKNGISFLVANRHWSKGIIRKTYKDIPYLFYREQKYHSFEINKK